LKILVIGGTGHVGSEVVKELKKRDADVRALVRKPGVKLYLLNAVTPDELTQVRIPRHGERGFHGIVNTDSTAT
jgi:uncharacterized protein YbjT (DUF2867 family)